MRHLIGLVLLLSVMASEAIALGAPETIEHGAIRVTLPGDRWIPLDDTLAQGFRAQSGFVDGRRCKSADCAVIVLVRPWDTVPAHPRDAEDLETYLDDVVRELETIPEAAVIESDVASTDPLVGRVHVLRSDGGPNRELDIDARFAVHQIGWSVPADEGLLQVFVFVGDTPTNDSLLEVLTRVEHYGFDVSLAAVESPSTGRSPWTVLMVVIALLAAAMLGLRLYQRARMRDRQHAFDVDANASRPTPEVPWEDELDALRPDDEASS